MSKGSVGAQSPQMNAAMKRTGFLRSRRRGLSLLSSNAGKVLGFDVGDILEKVVQDDPTNVELKAMVQQGQETRDIGIHDLINAGCGIEDISLAIYEVLQDEALPNFLPHVMLDQDGGLDRIQALWYWQKYIWWILSFSCIVLNYAMLLSLNWSVFKSVAYNWEPNIHEPLTMASALNSAQREALKEVEGDLFHSIPTTVSRHRFLAIASIIATSEMIGALVLLCFAARQILRFMTNGGVTKAHKSEYRAYRALESLFREIVPLMSTFSAIKLVYAIHPALLYSQFVNSVEECGCLRTYLGQPGTVGAIQMVWFVFTRLLLGSIAVMAFGVKLIVISAKLVNPSYCWVRSWMEVLALMNNCIGSVRLEQQLQDRLFLFIFGGNDAEFQDDERALRNVYRCRVTKQIWKEFWVEKREFIKAIAFLTTLNHYDLQTLLIEDTSVHITSFMGDKSSIVL